MLTPKRLLNPTGRVVNFWQGWGRKIMPFADVATPELPWRKLSRLALFQLTVGFCAALIIGTLNRVMIVELHLAAWIVSLMIAIPLLLAPARTVIGFRSDQHRSAFGWKRLPYLWFGTLMQFGGLAIMPFALIVLSGDSRAPHFVGPIAAALAFLLVGAGMHTTQTAGLALATDMAPEKSRPRVVGMLCMMLLLGICAGALGYGALLRNFSELRLVQVVQGSAVLTMIVNGIAMWQQEPRSIPAPVVASPIRLSDAWRIFRAEQKSMRRLATIGLGTMALSMQDILLEPYGGQILHLTVGQTTSLTAALAGGGLIGLAIAGWRLANHADPFRIAATGLLVGLLAFLAILGAAPLAYAPMFAAGVFLVGLSGGMFLVGTLSDAMSRARDGMNGLALGAWGSVQAVAAGSAIAFGGILRDSVGYLTANPTSGYDAVYLLEILLLFTTLIALGPLVRGNTAPRSTPLEA
jgi:BCD family chlorophyll transporter-like MFS transporter